MNQAELEEQLTKAAHAYPNLRRMDSYMPAIWASKFAVRVAICERWLCARSVAQRWIAVYSLSSGYSGAKDKQFVEKLLSRQLRRERSSKVLERIISTLGQIGSTTTVKRLTHLPSRFPQVELAVVQALCSSGNAVSRRWLTLFASSSNPDSREWVAFGLGGAKQSATVLASLGLLAHDSCHQVRLEAICSLLQHRVYDVIPLLFRETARSGVVYGKVCRQFEDLQKWLYRERHDLIARSWEELLIQLKEAKGR